MHKKTLLVLISSVITFAISFGQEKETVLNAPENWLTEIITFPMDFAPEIEFTGFEDLRFTPNWNKPDSPEFWSYMFVWYIDQEAPMTEDKLTESFNAYYNGLMRIDSRNEQDSLKTNQLDKTICLFVKTDEGFSGKMRVFDGFFEKEYMTLNIKVTESMCTQRKKQIIACYISLKPFDDVLWDSFDLVEVIVDCD